MANHLTPEELSKELGIERQEVIRVCVRGDVPIYHGKIDKFLFQAQLQALGADAPTALACGLAEPLASCPARRARRAGAVSSRRAPSCAAPLHLGDAAAERLHQVDRPASLRPAPAA